MNIRNDDFIFGIKDIIERRSKYQKVMLIYDNNITNADILEIYDKIKELCIFNKLNIDTERDRFDEIFDGYRTIIFFCSANSFLNINVDRTEFINIYVPIDSHVLPFFLDNKNSVSNCNNDYIFIKDKSVDISLIFSIIFNKFYNYIKNLMCFKSHYELDFDFNELSASKTEDIINSVDSDFEFVDNQILRECDIEYELLPLVDYLIINAFSLVIRSVRNHTLTMVDLYKAVKNDSALIDRFYALANNELFSNIINLNYNCINSLCEKCRLAILDRLSVCEEFNEQNIKIILSKIKKYFKSSNNILAYLYLYDVFGV